MEFHSLHVHSIPCLACLLSAPPSPRSAVLSVETDAAATTMVLGLVQLLQDTSPCPDAPPPPCSVLSVPATDEQRAAPFPSPVVLVLSTPSLCFSTGRSLLQPWTPQVEACLAALATMASPSLLQRPASSSPATPVNSSLLQVRRLEPLPRLLVRGSFRPRSVPAGSGRKEPRRGDHPASCRHGRRPLFSRCEQLPP
ncbi:uncharacterized protein [Triticum aestivum]|uniref:uncharacterized protein n=1 Tax=Triticum aestivum TaxID=4565 RepID=UPI001D00F23D|nr:uncharacterized protein LOC123065365 [Triticum aestivum]